jgi:hypothetical protein
MIIEISGKSIRAEVKTRWWWVSEDDGKTWRRPTPYERTVIRNNSSQKKDLHRANSEIADSAYAVAKTGDLIGATNIIMNALTHGYKIGPRTAIAIGNILIEEGFLTGETEVYRQYDYHPRADQMEMMALNGRVGSAIQALLFSDKDGGCKMYWTKYDALEYNKRKWVLFDIIQRGGGKLRHG